MNRSSILMVDDEEKILDAVSRELFFWSIEQNIGLYKARSALEALDILQENHESISVLITDLKMSGLGGDELIEEVRQRYPDIQSILVTGYGELGGISRAVSAGISAFIPKPWDTAELIAQIEKAMRLFKSEVSSRVHQSRLMTQLERTGQIQKRLFKPEAFSNGAFEIDITYEPLSDYRCGGDFYQVIPVTDERGLFIVGDVSGHGIEAAFVTGIVRTLIGRDEPRMLANPDFSPAAFLAKLNAQILKELARAPELLIAMSAAMIDRAAGRMVMSNAGNLPVYRIRNDSCDTFAVSGCPCGFSPEAEFEDLAVPIQAGDRLALMTDGLIERGRIEGWVKLDAVKALMRHFKDQPDFNKHLVQLVLEMLPDGKFHDDATLITVRVR